MDLVNTKQNYYKNNGLTIKTSLQSLMVGCLFLYCIVFPADQINIKEIILFLTMIVCFPAIYMKLKKQNNAFFVFYAFVFPFLTTLISITVGDSSIYNSLSNGYMWLFLLLIPAIEYYQIDIKRIFIFGTLIIAILTDFIFIGDISGFVPINSNPLVSFFAGINELRYGKGLLATFGYSIFFKTCPLGIFTYCYALKNKKWIMAIVFLVEFFASGTRANLLVALIATAAVLIFSSDKVSKKLLIVFALITIIIIFAPNFIERMAALNSLKMDRSEAIKIAAIDSIFKHMNSDPLRYYLFGTGVGSYFYHSGRGLMVNVVETSFFDYLRQLGLIFFSAFMYFLCKPIKILKTEDFWLLVAYIGYLAIAFTNPLLVSSTSFVAYVMIFSRGFSRNSRTII